MFVGIYRSFVVAVVALSTLAVGAGEKPAPIATYTFGLSLNTGMNNQLFTLFVVKEFEGEVLSADPITREQFMQQAQGAVASKANLAGINLFRKYDVAMCYLQEDTALIIPDCAVFDQLWKIRFWEYPFRPSNGQHPGKGWAEQREAPSARQQMLLVEYGILHLSGLAKGNENVFKLLHDVGDPAWVDNYRKGY